MVIASTKTAAAQPRFTHPTSSNAMMAIVSRVGIFHTADPTAVAGLTRHLQPMHFSRRQEIYGEDEVGDQLFIVISGKVKIGKRSMDGRGHLLAVIGQSEMFGELSVFDPGPRAESATALTEVTAVAIDRDAFRAWVADHREIAERLMRVLARRLRRTNIDLSDVICADVAGRVAKQLLRLAQRFGVRENGALRVTHNLTQEEMAQLIGAARETVNKVLSDFAAQGWIRLDGPSMLIIETESLVRRVHRITPPDNVVASPSLPARALPARARPA